MSLSHQTGCTPTATTRLPSPLRNMADVMDCRKQQQRRSGRNAEKPIPVYVYHGDDHDDDYGNGDESDARTINRDKIGGDDDSTPSCYTTKRRKVSLTKKLKKDITDDTQCTLSLKGHLTDLETGISVVYDHHGIGKTTTAFVGRYARENKHRGCV